MSTGRVRNTPADPFADDIDDDQDDEQWEMPARGNERQQMVRSTCTHSRPGLLDRMVGAHNVSSMRPPISASTYLAWLVMLVVGSAVAAAVGTVLIITGILFGFIFLLIRNYIQISRRS